MEHAARLFVLFAIFLLGLNFVTFLLAYPETTRVDSGCCAPGSAPLAKDYSAYYVGAWRLIHDPSQVYTKGIVEDGGPQVDPRPQQYKYLPSFLVMIVPLLFLPYQSSLLAFDVLQFLLLPLVALLTYLITKERGLLVSSLVAVAILLQPSPIPGWGLSATYYWQWGEGQSKILLTFLLVLAFYFAKSGHPRLAGVACALASFDLRFTVLAAPLLLSYSKGSWAKLATSFAAAMVVLNLPLAIPGVASGFVGVLLSGGATALPYYYSWIPIVTVVALTAADWEKVNEAFGFGVKLQI